MKKVSLLLIATGMVALASCSNVKTRSYKVRVIKTGINLIATSEEPKDGLFNVYVAGDTVMIDAKHSIGNGRAKSVIICKL